MRLSQLKRHQQATIVAVACGAIPVAKSPTLPSASVAPATAPGTDAISQRLMTLGFIPGEPVKVLARGLFGGDPIMVQIGFTRFALRRSEADRIEVEVHA